jgi:DNA-binding GntR family transcriptional regulator
MESEFELRNGVELPSIERPESVKDRVLRAIENAILGGLIPRDEILTEGGLANKLSVSRTPVREALQELGKNGLLESAGRRGKRIRRLRKEEVRELYWLRQVLEGAIVERLAAAGLTADQVSAAHRHLEDQRAAMSADDRLAFLSADSRFHIALAEFLGFPKVTAIILNLRQLLHLSGVRAVRRLSRFEEVLSEHVRILAAIEHKDPNAARQAINEHLERTEKLVLAELEAGG